MQRSYRLRLSLFEKKISTCPTSRLRAMADPADRSLEHAPLSFTGNDIQFGVFITSVYAITASVVVGLERIGNAPDPVAYVSRMSHFPRL